MPLAYIDLVFEWDEAKSEANLRRRGFDFAHAVGIFDGPTLEMDDDRADYGERRIQAIGRVNKREQRCLVRRLHTARPRAPHRLGPHG